MQISSEEISSEKNSNHFQRYLQFAVSILSAYNGQEPFKTYLKKYFALNKKHGSRDRRLITSLCYNYFRLGFGVSIDEDQNQKFFLATFLCETKPAASLQLYKPKWNNSISLPLDDKLQIVEDKFAVDKLFPYMNELSDEIDRHLFNLSFLIQPKVFIRIRPGCKNIVLKKIKQSGFSFIELEENCIAFPNNEKITDIIKVDKEAVVQDYNSQKTLHLLKPLAGENNVALSIWDCCAGSGGKSILASDLFTKVRLTVSDKRKEILENLKLRFTRAGIKDYKLIGADLEKLPVRISESFDIIIADVPCTGSGTWARTPERLLFFKESEIEHYALLQRVIIDNALPYLKKNGHLLYITCSVFKKENEENVAFLKEKHQLNLIETVCLKGYEMQADTLFVALFTKGY